jgi:hypothetical protein
MPSFKDLPMKIRPTFNFYLVSLTTFVFLALCSFSCEKKDDPTPVVVTPAPGVIPDKPFDTLAAINRMQKLTFQMDTTISSDLEVPYVFNVPDRNDPIQASRYRELLQTPQGSLFLELPRDSTSLVNPANIGHRFGEVVLGDFTNELNGDMRIGFDTKTTPDTVGYDYDTWYCIEQIQPNADSTVWTPVTDTYYHVIKSITYLGRVDAHAFFKIEGEFVLEVKNQFGNDGMTRPHKTVTGSYRKIWQTNRK